MIYFSRYLVVSNLTANFDNIHLQMTAVVQHGRERLWLRLYSKCVCAAVLLLIFAGALVTSHQAGLAVPDWPTTYGQNMFLFPYSEWRGNIFFEHSHRLIASGVGFLTIILTVWIACVERRRWVRVLSYCALAAVVMQGLLGGLTVLFYLPAAVSMSHAVLAQTFFVLTIIIAYSQSGEFLNAGTQCEGWLSGPMVKTSLATVIIVYMQLFLGALMRHTYSGLAIPDFPTMGGDYLPVFNEDLLSRINDMLFSFGLDRVSLTQVLIHLAHRVGGLCVVIAVLLMLLWALKEKTLHMRTRRTAWYIALLCAAQFALGVFSVLTLKSPLIASIHVLGGAALLGLTALLVMRAISLPKKSL